MTKGHHVLYLDPSWEVEKPLTGRPELESDTCNRLSEPLNQASGNDRAPMFELSEADVVEETADSFDGNYSSPTPFPGEETFSALTAEAELSFGTDSALHSLVGIIANVTESYTSAIFVAPPGANCLEMAAVQTLSRDFIADTRIEFGSGLVGWTAENKVRISVCPFEHESTTLLYYDRDQSLKSFIAIPIVGSNGALRGVIACDSKKSYAFSKLVEKILLQCAEQAASIIEMEGKLYARSQSREPDEDALALIREALRNQDHEETLLEIAAQLPESVISRDALIAITTAEGGVGEGQYFTVETEGQLEHRLLDLVYKHKKVICSERTVHVLPTNDITERSFLSVPFHVLGKEAGSLNLLSKPRESFEAAEIASLEDIARVIGRELERIRLRDCLSDIHEREAMLSWKHFRAIAASQLEEAREARISMSLLRVQFQNLVEIEESLGFDATSALDRHVRRLMNQVKGQNALACSVFGSQHLVLLPSEEVDRVAMRLQTMLKRVKPEDLSSDLLISSSDLIDLLMAGLKLSVADSTHGSSGLDKLISGTLDKQTPGHNEWEKRQHVRA